MFEWLNISAWFASFDVNTFLRTAGSDPISAAWMVFVSGGWIIVAAAFIYIVCEGWLEYKQNLFDASRDWILLRIAAPRVSEQTPKAAENIFANLAGAHGTFSWVEKWFQGQKQQNLSIEIASINGEVGFYIRCLKNLRDLVEASIYAQYPDAEIEVVEDYARKVPAKFPDEAWDMWGAEWVNVAPDPYPLKTYPEFEDHVSGEFKDPMASMLENFSRIGPGEQIWYQIILHPTDQKDVRERGEKLIKKLRGEKIEKKKTVLDHVMDMPLQIVGDVASVALGTSPTAPKKKDEKPPVNKMLLLSPGEKFVLEAVERKLSKIGFMCKIRFIYIAKKEKLMKPRALNPFVGAIKQTNTFNMQSLKPETKKTGVNTTLWWFKQQRNNLRKTKMVMGYRNRSHILGMKLFFLSTEELATLWHFPILLQVKAPQLRRIEAKKHEAPINIPFEE